MRTLRSPFRLALRRPWLLVMAVTLSTMLAGCWREPLVEPVEAEQFQLVVVPRWVELDKRPTGMTVMIYPTDGSAPITLTSNDVDSITTYLRPGSYKVLCFNQTESEFTTFHFRHMESFGDCEIVANEDPAHAGAFPIFADSRMSTQPEVLAVDYYTALSVTQEEIDESYREGKSLKKVVTLYPHVVVSTLYITVPVYGIYNAYSVTGCIDGLARNLYLTYYESGRDRASHIIPQWTPHYESISSDRGSFTSTSTTLGLPGMSLHITPTGYEETRHEPIDYLQPTRGGEYDLSDPIFEDKDIRFHLRVLLKDLKTVVDTTYLVGDMIKRRDNYQLILDLNLNIDITLPYVTPADGSSTAGFDVDFDDWIYEYHDISF